MVEIACFTGKDDDLAAKTRNHHFFCEIGELFSASLTDMVCVFTNDLSFCEVLRLGNAK